MANSNNTRLAILVSLLAGVILGVGTVHYAEMTANMIVARTDFNYRSQRYNDTLANEGISRGDGLSGARGLDWSTTDTRTEKAPATALHGVAIEKLRYCVGQSPVRRSQCLVNAANEILEDEAAAQAQGE